MLHPGELAEPIVQAPMAGGPSTVALAAAVCEAGGLGFLAAGYRTAEQMEADIRALRAATARPFGVNVFVPSDEPVDEAGLRAYLERLRAAGHEPGEPHGGDDAYEEKLAILSRACPPVVSFTFGCPAALVVEALHRCGAAVWVTVTSVEEALRAQADGADALVVQGVEAGGHRASFRDGDGAGELALLPLLRLVARAVELPLVASGGIADGGGVAAVLAAGAEAAQLGTAFLLTPEAATSAPHRRALTELDGATALTRAFTGRQARGLVNGFLVEHSAHAPLAYPHVHHATAALRRAARERGDADAINLWAGQAHPLAEEAGAGELVRRLGADARAALAAAARRATVAAQP